MKRTLLSVIMPPAAVVRHGCASCTAAPISVFWLSSLASLTYGLMNGIGGAVAMGALLWLIAAAWARLVLRGVESDHLRHADSTQVKLAIPQVDEADPFAQLRTSL